jgi:uncharacterized Zn-finger protein
VNTKTHSYNTSVVLPQCSPSYVTSITNTSVLLIILIVASVFQTDIQQYNLQQVCALYFPIIHDNRDSIVMYSSVCDGKYSWPILSQNILFDDDIRQMKPNSFFVYVFVFNYFEYIHSITLVILRKYYDRMLCGYF